MDEFFMRMALREAEKAWDQGEVPIGAVVVREGEVLGKGYNLTEKLQDPMAHAEVLAISAAAEALGSRRLEGCTIYVTLEPCCMCAGAIVLARIPRVVFGTHDPKAGACRSLYTICDDHRLNHRAEIHFGVMQEECASLLTAFFRELRHSQKKKNTDGIRDN